MEEAQLLTARVLVETADGSRVEGFSSDLLVPKWFRKDPDKTAEEDALDLIASAKAAAAVLTDPHLGFRSAFQLWWHAYRQLAESRPDGADLVSGFGLALL